MTSLLLNIDSFKFLGKRYVLTANLLTPIEKIYYLRAALGIIAALVGTGFGFATNAITNGYVNGVYVGFDYTVLFNGITLMLVVYLLSYYVIKAKYASQVVKPTKLMTTGIGIYLLGWIVFWVFLYTVIAGPPPASLVLGF